MINLLAMSTSDYNQTWHFIVQIAILLSALLLANTIRRRVPFIKKSLLPSAVIGGLILLILKLIPPVANFIDETFMEIVSYHCLGLGFVSMTLKDSGEKRKGQGMTVFKTGATVVNTYLLQAVVGLTITVPLSLLAIYKDKLFAGAGLLLAFGFGQGPGQALNNGVILNKAQPYFDGSSFGLAIATIGFLVACLIGVIYLNVARKQGKIKTGSNQFVDETTTNAKDIIPISESVDRLSMQVALVFLAYGLSYLVLFGIDKLMATGILGNFGQTVSDLFYGFNFLMGTVFAVLTKQVLKLLRKSNLMNHTYTDNYLLNRISGFVFDTMILAATAAIDFNKLEGLWVPLIAVCAVGGIATFVYLRFVCKRLYPTYTEEAFASLFGMLTGTASTGTILLREIDPEFKTPASYNMVMQSMPAVLFGFPIMLLVGLLKKGLAETLICAGIFLLLFIAFNLFTMFDFKRKKFISLNDFTAPTNNAETYEE